MNDACAPHDLGKFREDLQSMIQRVRAIGSEILLRTPNPIINMADGTECEELLMGGRKIRYMDIAVSIMRWRQYLEPKRLFSLI